MTFRRRARGRFFSTRYDTKRMQVDMQAYQEQMGQLVQWWFFDLGTSTYDETYGEPDLYGGRRYKGPTEIPVMSAVRIPGDRRRSDSGLYTVDTLEVRMSYEQARKAGLGPDVDVTTTPHLNDRIGYEGRIFELRDILVSGQYDPTQTYLVMLVTATQLRPDELVMDTDFAAYAT